MGIRLTKIAVIGDSHLGALKHAWQEIEKAHSDVQLTFFGTPKESSRHLRLIDRKIVPSTPTVENFFKLTSGGRAYISVDDYDFFILHGLGVSLHRFIVTEIIKSNNFGDSKLPLHFGEYLDRSNSIMIAKILDSLGLRYLVSPSPFTSEKASNRPNWRKLQNSNGSEPNQGVKALQDVLENFLIEHHGFQQPESTISRGMFTKQVFGHGVKKMASDSNEFPAEDVVHANAEYGKVILPLLIETARRTLNEPSDITGNTEPEARVKIPHSSKNDHPYRSLPDRCFWKRTVSGRTPTQIDSWYRKKFDIGDLRLASAGSCFAQHLGKRLRTSGFKYLDAEPAPSNLPQDLHQQHGYGMYSARYGNIYTTRQLLQLIQRANGEFVPQTRSWKHENGYVDPFRPNIPFEPYEREDDVEQAQDDHLSAVRELLSKTDVFIFTLGLTETWVARSDGASYPIAPGVSGGEFDQADHQFLNLTYPQVMDDFTSFMRRASDFNPSMRFILTVSPVPLMATARSDTQVAVSTMHAKSILRAAAGQLELQNENVDYFPSFEIISSHVSRGQFFENDMRSVSPVGVDHVMQTFFAEHSVETKSTVSYPEDEDPFCDEELLDAFST